MHTMSRASVMSLLVVLGLSGPALAAPPVNDSFSTPLVLSGLPASVLSSNVEATLEPGEPDPENYLGDVQASVWFQWTSPTSGSVRIDTLDSDFDTVLAVWTGTTVNALTMLADNDQFGGDQSAVYVTVVSGATYRLAVYGWYEERGSIRLTVTNDRSATIAGQITGPDEVTPLEGIEARPYQWDGFGWSSMFSQATYSAGDGMYEIRGLPAGTYRVRFRDFSGYYLREYYDDASDVDSATDIEVLDEERVDGIDASLAEASKISGQVTGSDEVTPAENIDVTASTWNGVGWDLASAASTDASGYYTIGDLTAGTYRVQFDDSAGNFISEAYNDQETLDAGQDIVVAATTTVTGINAALREASRISGTVTGPDETTPLENIVATVYVRSGSSWFEKSSDYTDASGFYSAGGLTAGTYRVQFEDYNGTYLREAYDDQATLDDGQDIVVPGTTTVAGIDASLGLASRISGTVTGPDDSTPLASVSVSAWAFDGAFWNTTAIGTSTDGDGNYSLGGLEPGTYRVSFNGSFFGYAPEFYDDAADVFSATDIVVPATTTVFGIDASLSAGASLAGTVTGPDELTPLPDIQVTAYYPSGLGWSGQIVSTDSSGSYTIQGLAPGDYRIEFRDPAGNYIAEYYDDRPDLTSALDVTLAGGATVTGLDASLAVAGRISGQLYGPDGIAPATGITVSVYAGSGSSWTWVSGGSSDAAGAYQVGGLTAGTYRVQFSDPFSGVFVSQVYSNAPNLTVGLDVVVTPGTEVTGIDAVLQAASRIQGQITRRDGVTVPEATILIYAYRWNGADYDYVGNDVMLSDGTYTLGGLLGGTYRLYFTAAFNLGYQSAYYTNSPTLGGGTDIVVPAGDLVPGIDMSLTAYSRILGRITRADGTTPIEGITASVYAWNGVGYDWINAGTTDADGTYVVNQLYAGTYRIHFVDGGGLYLAEAFEDAATLAAGTDVVAPEDGDAENVNGRMGLDVDMESARPDVIGFVRKTNTVWEVRFTAVSGLVYRVRSSAGLTQGWLDHTAPMISQGGTNTLTVTGSADRVFFGIQAEP